MSDKKIRTRFAPSPTGYMHIGNLRTALYAYLFARNNNGTFILRIEDTDRERYVDGAVDIIYSTLEQAGIERDEGPDKDKGYGPYVQSERKDIYLKYAKELVERDGAYYCFCSKERIESLVDENGNHNYDGHCKKLSAEEVEKKLKAGEPYVIRQKIGGGISEYEDMVFGKISVPCADMTEGILLKSDRLPTYNFANVVDDHLMDITHVIRGTEYLSSTPQYNLIYDCMGWERPKYMHLPPIMKDAQRKLSKRYGDANFDDFIAKGYLPHAIVNYIALLGWTPKDNTEIMDMEQLVQKFDVGGISHSGSIFDEPKMKWMNGEYIKRMTADEFLSAAEPFFQKSKVYGKYDLLLLSQLLKSRVEIFSDIPSHIDFLEEYGDFDINLLVHEKSNCTLPVARHIISEAIPMLERIDWEEEDINNFFYRLPEKLEVKKGAVFWAIRVGITGRVMTPGGGTEMCLLIGKQETVKRLKQVLSRLSNA